jgi:hypothetical protein
MSLEVNAQVVRYFWPGFLPLGFWICGFLLVVFVGKTERRKLCRILLWVLPVFLLQTAWVMWIVMTVSKSPL